MKKADIKIGAMYLVKVTGNLVTVKIDRENPLGGWDGTNLKTKRSVRIKSAQRIRRRVADGDMAREQASAERAAQQVRKDIARTVQAVDKGDLTKGVKVPTGRKKRGGGIPKAKKATSFAGLTGSAFTEAINAADVGALRTALADGGKLTAKQRGRIEAALAHKIKTPPAKPAAKQAGNPPPPAKGCDTGERDATGGHPGANEVKPMSLMAAAAHLLSLGAGDAMRCKDIVDLAVKRNLWTPGAGKTPANTLYASILREITTKGEASRFVKTEPGKFALAPKR